MDVAAPPFVTWSNRWAFPWAYLIVSAPEGWLISFKHRIGLLLVAGMYPTASLTLVLLPIFGILFVATNVLRYGHRDKRLPPGPRTVPIFGNALQIPKSRFPQKYTLGLSSISWHTLTVAG
jgi:hypothetical protein